MYSGSPSYSLESGPPEARDLGSNSPPTLLKGGGGGFSACLPEKSDPAGPKPPSATAWIREETSVRFVASNTS